MTTVFMRAWLVIALAVSFTTFGLGSLLLAWIVIPACRLMRGSSAARDLRVQRCIHWALRGVLAQVRVLGLARLHWLNRARIREAGPCLIVSNHPTLIDVVILLAALPQADCVVKRASWNNRFLGPVVRGAGYIPNDGPTELLQACVDRLEEGRTVILFPEGTRSHPGTLGSFKRGAAHVSLTSGCPLVPVAITCEPPGLGKGTAWYASVKHRMSITMSVLKPISAVLADTWSDGRRSVAARELTESLRRRIETELERGR